MMTLFKIETFKLLKRKKTLVVLIAFMLLTAFIGYASYRDVQNYKRYSSPEARIADMERFIQREKEEKNIIPENIKNDEKKTEEYKAQKDQSIESMQAEINNIKAMQNNSIDWKEGLQKQIKGFEDRQKQIKDMKDAGTSYEMDYLDSQINLNKYLLEHNIKPVDQQSEFRGFGFITSLINILGEVFLAIGIAVFAADMVSGEASPPTMKLLLTQPVSRAKVLFSKFMSINLMSVVFIVGVELLAFLGVGLFFGFGDAAYPTVVGARYEYDTTQLMQGGSYPLAVVAGSRYIIPAWQHLVRLLLMQSLYIVACVSVVFLISALVKNSMVSMGASVVSVIGTSIIFLGFGAFKSLARFIFVLFGKVGDLVNGSIAMSMSNPKITIESSIVMFVVWIVVSYAAAHIIFTKKDILI